MRQGSPNTVSRSLAALCATTEGQGSIQETLSRTFVDLAKADALRGIPMRNMCDALQVYVDRLGSVPPFTQISNVGIGAGAQVVIRKPISARSREPPSCRLDHGDLIRSVGEAPGGIHRKL